MEKNFDYLEFEWVVMSQWIPVHRKFMLETNGIMCHFNSKLWNPDHTQFM